MRLCVLIYIFFLTGCGSSKGPYDEREEMISLRPDSFYTVKFKALNGYKLPRLKSSFQIKGIQFHAKVVMWSKNKSSGHLQFIHEGDQCPNKANDSNEDGFIDAHEVVDGHEARRILIPLDGDIKDQGSKFHYYPVTNDEGYYRYSKATSYNKLVRELRSKELRSTPYFAKLGRNEDLELDRRVLIIYGVSSAKKLPESLQAYGGFSQHLMVPIACGVIASDTHPQDL